MKRVLSVVLALVLALAWGMDTPRTQSRADVAQALVDRAAAGEEISVIVGVGAAFVPEGALADAGAVADQRASIAQAVDAAMARAAAVGVTVGSKFDNIPFFTARVNRAQLEALATTAGVTSINEDYELSASLNVSTGMINAPAAWAAGGTGAGWGVAVLDTGVETTHSFLGGRIASQACYSDNLGAPNSTTSVCPGGVNSDTSGGGACAANGCDHGTHVAGTASGANGPGGTNGVAPGSSIHAIQVFSQTTSCGSGPSPCTTAYTSDVIRGLQRVLALHNLGHKIAAVNMSLGGGQFFTEASCDSSNAATKAAIDNLRVVGIASVVASGNEAFSNSLAAPGCISSAVAVGATTKGICTGPGAPPNIGCPGNAVPGQISVPAFSNVATFLDLYAPGSFINASVIGNTFGTKSGTSMATPHVAGAWAVMKQAAPTASVPTVLAAFTGTGTPITEPFTGLVHPMINVNAARVALGGGGGGTPTGPPNAPTNFAVAVSGFNLNMTWTAPVATASLSPSAAAATGYTLVVRAGGALLGTAPLGNVTTFNVTSPSAGVFSLSVQGTNSFGTGPESNVVTVTVPSVPAAPGAPTNLVATVVGNTVIFTWAAPTTGGAVANYVILAGATPGFTTPLGSAVLPATPTSLPVPGVPNGVFYARVFAQNGGGNSPQSNEVQFVVGATAPPGAPTLNTPTVSAGNTVGLSWSPGAGPAPTSYTLIVALSPGGPLAGSLALTGTSVSFPGVPSGTFFLKLVANNSAGASPPSLEVTLTVP